MSSTPTGSNVNTARGALLLLLHVDDHQTTVELAPDIAVSASRRIGDDSADGFQCGAVARLAQPHSAAPPPHLYFTDLNHAHRFVTNSGGGWLPDIHPLVPAVSCEYQLIRARTTIPLPAGAPVFAANLDHLVHLAAYWFEATAHAGTRSISGEGTAEGGPR